MFSRIARVIPRMTPQKQTQLQFLSRRSFFEKKVNVEDENTPIHELRSSNKEWEMVYEGFLHTGIRRLKIVREMCNVSSHQNSHGRGD